MRDLFGNIFSFLRTNEYVLSIEESLWTPAMFRIFVCLVGASRLFCYSAFSY